jgi:hypothetical protein
MVQGGVKGRGVGPLGAGLQHLSRDAGAAGGNLQEDTE